MTMKEKICPICRENKYDVETQCGHLFHFNCLKISTENKGNDEPIELCLSELFRNLSTDDYDIAKCLPLNVLKSDNKLSSS